LLVVVFGRSAGDEDPAEADVALLLRGATLLDEAFLLAGLLAETDEALLLAGTDGTLLAETDEALLPAGADELGKTVITEVITVGTQLEMVWIEITGVEGLLVLEGGWTTDELLPVLTGDKVAGVEGLLLFPGATEELFPVLTEGETVAGVEGLFEDLAEPEAFPVELGGGAFKTGQ
jgi:hypothetical protein